MAPKMRKKQPKARKIDPLIRKLLPEHPMTWDQYGVDEFYRLDSLRLSEILDKLFKSDGLRHVFLRKAGIEIHGLYDEEEIRRIHSGRSIGMLVSGDYLGKYCTNLYLVTLNDVATEEERVRMATIKPNLVNLLREFIT